MGSKADETATRLKSEFYDCDDFNLREILFPDGTKVYLANIGNYSDRTFISENIVKPIMAMKEPPKKKDDFLGLVSANEFAEIDGFETCVDKVLSGCAVIFAFLEGDVVFYSATAKKGNGRGVEEPNSEVVVRGPREGFIESSEDNVALLRKRIRTSDFKAVNIKLGLYTKTVVTICYINKIAKSDTVERVKKCFDAIELPGVIDSGYIEHYLQKSSPSLFTNVGNSEKPDKVAAKLLEGRIAIICDGSPVVLTVPYLFIESLQSAEDYLKTPYYATFIRVLRMVSVFIALYLPSLYLASLEHHSGDIPYKLYMKVIEARRDIPFGVFSELIVILAIFELIREVGIRMPRAVGDAVGIVAGLILGDAAISAGIASPPVIMVAALTAVSSFIVPPYMNSMVLIRFINLIITKLFGFAGVVISLTFILTELCRKDSFGVPYLSPFTPIKFRGLSDGLIMLPKMSLKRASSELKNEGEGDKK